MRRKSIAATMVVLAPAVFAAHAAGSCQLAQSGQGVQYVLPDPKSFIEAGAQCANKAYVAPNVQAPECPDLPGKFRCVLTYTDCSGSNTVHSSVKDGGQGMCKEYWDWHDALANRNICCPRATRKRK
jgi:hypothetical protein